MRVFYLAVLTFLIIAPATVRAQSLCQTQLGTCVTAPADDNDECGCFSPAYGQVAGYVVNVAPQGGGYVQGPGVPQGGFAPGFFSSPNAMPSRPPK